MKVIRITALWCMSCIVMNNRIEKLKDTYSLDFEDYDYDMDDISDLTDSKILPVFIFYNENNEEITRFEGELSFRKLEKKLKEITS